jgi:hypothetical protein
VSKAFADMTVRMTDDTRVVRAGEEVHKSGESRRCGGVPVG